MYNDDNDIEQIFFFAFLTMWLYQAFICIDYWL